jgi:hypothetical protein
VGNYVNFRLGNYGNAHSVGRYQRELILWQAGECPVDLLDAFTAASLVTALGASNVVLPSGSGNQ